MIARLYIGWIWLEAGIEKIINPAWVGDSAGAAIKGFVGGALKKTVGEHPDVQGWYASFLQSVVLPNAEIWGYLIAWGEFLIGIALILGFLTGIAAFFGAFMNWNFLMAGTVSINPIMFPITIILILAWKTAGYWGLDRYVLPALLKSGRRGRISR